MDDLIKRLRSQEAVDAKPHEIEQLTDEAADALEAANTRISELTTCKLCRSTGNDTPCAYPTEINRQQAKRIAELVVDVAENDALIDSLQDQLTAKTELATLYAASLRQSEEEVEGLRRDATRTRSITDAEVDAACNAYVRERGTLHEVMRAVIRAARHAALSQTKEQS